jgi:excisionase family DNA binding protein
VNAYNIIKPTGGRSEELRVNPPQVLNAREVAIYLGISERKVRSETTTGLIPHIRMGGRVLYRLQDIERLLDKLMVGGVS